MENEINQVELKTYPDLMVDIETMGKDSNSAIVSIGACEFDIMTGETGRTFYINVNLQSCLDAGLKVNGETIMWWLKQSEEARRALTTSKQFNLSEALIKFSKFCTKDYTVWAKGPRFDFGILSDAYNASFLEIPWNFRKEKCVRTMEGFNEELYNELYYKENFVKHNALADCLFQIKVCSTIRKTISVNKD